MCVYVYMCMHTSSFRKELNLDLCDFKTTLSTLQCHDLWIIFAIMMLPLQKLEHSDPVINFSFCSYEKERHATNKSKLRIKVSFNP